MKSRAVVVLVVVLLASPLMIAPAEAPAGAVVGGIRVAIRMPYAAGGRTGPESPSTHAHLSASGFGWDLLSNLNQPVYARAASSEGTVTIHVGAIGANAGGTGKWVQVVFKVNGTRVGTVWFEHLQKLRVTANHPTDYPEGQLLGFTGAGTFADRTDCGASGGKAYGYAYSSSWQVCTPTRVHTQANVANGCWRSLPKTTTIDAGAAIMMLSTRYSAKNNSRCDATELAHVNAGNPASTWIGTWSGRVTQTPSYSVPYSVSMHIVSVRGTTAGTVTYPGLACDGVLGLVSVTASTLRLAEHITHPGPHGCIDGGHITMHMSRIGVATWVGTLVGGPTGTATLQRR